MSTVARLNADLTANSTQFESGLKRANSAMNQSRTQWNSALSQASRSFDSFQGHVTKSAGSVVDLRSQIGGLATAVAASLSVQKIIQYSDQWKQLSSRLSIVTADTREMAQVQESLFQIAQKNSTPVGDTVDAYVRLSNSLKDAQKEQFNLLNITDLLAKTLKISGSNAASAATFLQQFGQAASNDFKAIGQELQTFADQNPVFYKIIRDEAEKSGKSLKDFAKDGGLSFAFVAKALTDASDQIEEDASRIQLTVGQSLTNLDSAFLKFIGQSELAKTGTSSLAAGINLAAENFGYLALAAGAVATVFGANLVRSLGAAAVAFVAATVKATAFNYNLGVMAFGSRAASVAMVGLAGSVGVLSTAIAFLGGPLGVAILGTLALMATNTNAAADAMQNLNLRSGEFRQAAADYMGASNDVRKTIEENTRANIEGYKLELEAVLKIAQTLNSENGLFKAARNIGSKLGIDTSAKDVLQYADQIKGTIADLEGDLKRFDDIKSGKVNTGGNTAAENTKAQEKAIQNVLRGLREESQELVLQNDLYGKKPSLIERELRALKIRNQLADAGVVLTAAQTAEVEKYISVIEAETDKLDALETHQERVTKATEEFGSIMKSSFEDAIIEGESLTDVLDNLEKSLAKLFLQTQIFDPIADIFKKGSSGGGILDDFFGKIIPGSGSSTNSATDSGGGLWSSIKNWLPSFDVGTNYVPHDMIAQIHKGETIVPAYDAAKMRQGGGDGDLTVNIINNGNSKVTTSKSEGANGTELNIMIDQMTAENIARTGTKTNTAIKALNNRTLVRR